MALKNEFALIKSIISKKFPKLKKTKLITTHKEDIAHEFDSRHFASCFASPPTIFYAKTLEKQPLSRIDGILWHEIGHLIDMVYGKRPIVKEPKVIIETFKVKEIKGDDYQCEVTANNNVYVYFGKLIRYDDELVQYI